MKIKQIIILSIVAFFCTAEPSVAYEAATLEKVMTELEGANSTLFKKAKKVYKYATINTNEIIEKPLLTKHNKALNAFVDRKNKVSASFTHLELRVLKQACNSFKFAGKKYKVVENYTRQRNAKSLVYV